MEKRYFSVDRIEDGMAVLEGDDGKLLHIPLGILPPELAEGDVLAEDGGRFTPDPQERDARRQQNIALLRKLMKKD